MSALHLKVPGYQFYSLLFTIIICLVLYLLSNSLSKESIVSFLSQFGVWLILAFIILNTLTYVIVPLSNTPLLLAGFYLFGQKVVFYFILSMLISMFINYWIARVWGRGMVVKIAGKENIAKINNFLKSYNSVLWFVVLRLLQGAWHKFISLAFGLVKMEFVSYSFLSVITLVPFAVVWYILAGRVNNPVSFTILSQILGIAPPVFLSIMLFLMRLL